VEEEKHKIQHEQLKPQENNKQFLAIKVQQYEEKARKSDNNSAR